MRISLTKLHTFYLVARHGSMKKAAALLYVSPPAVTMQIRKLEEELGVSVFARGQGPLCLTERGRELYALVSPMFSQLDVIERYVSGLVQGEDQVLRLGTHHLPANYFIPDLIAHVRAEHPDLHVQMSLGTQDRLLEKLSMQELDLALIIGEPPSGSSFQAVPLFGVNLAPVTADPALLPSGHASMRDLADVPLILQQHGSGARQAVLDWFERFGVTPNIFWDNLSSDVIKQFLPTTKALSFIGRFIVQAEIDEQLFREIKIDEGLPVIRFHLVSMDAGSLPRKIRLFLEGFKDFSPCFHTVV